MERAFYQREGKQAFLISDPYDEGCVPRRSSRAPILAGFLVYSPHHGL